jgi:uncharacterized cupredoxin-like copper-binding protein
MKAFFSSNPRALLMTKVTGLLTIITLALLPFASTLMALACHAPTVDANSTNSSAEKTQDVFVILKEFSITSSRTTFAQGVHYHFIIANGGTMMHELMISPPMMDPMMSMEQMDSMALASVQNINPGQVKTLDYTFTKPYQQGALELACHMMDHYQKGMHTPIEVDASKTA